MEIFEVTDEVGPPFDVEADHSGASLIIGCDLEGLGEPLVDEGRSVGDETVDLVVVKGDIVEVVGVVW
ncbi:hypothetical protein K2173_019174 [Erythroxylum novogranatense]|uniref:Uncharacterized protein n=1 Tax=Erythroxylum novogranatense TaxID=1862640 RepID=A0AAV8SSW6_9ROSI|nr:hypothetical protein K2173_019174 [Erythroxylum novogranatense]